MLTDPHRSRVLLIHPDRCVMGDACDSSREWCGGVSLLAATRTTFKISPVLVGERDAVMGIVGAPDNGCITLDVDPLAMWKTGELPSALGMGDAAVLFFGGAWLEEDVLMAAIRAASAGYDVRILTDMSRLRREADRQLVADRATMHGILTVTLRQALLEWAVFTEDRATIAQVRALLA